MPKYRVYQIATASNFIGEFEAETEDEAKQMAFEVADSVQLCHQCAHEIDLGEWYDEQAEKISD